MDIRQLRNFVAVADHKNFTRAAAFLNLSQPALSVSIRNLEHELDATLFIRTPKETLITDIGANFLVHARAVLREIEKAEEIVAATKSKKSQTVRIGISSLFSNIIAREVIGTFCTEHPNVKIESDVVAHPAGEAIQRIASGHWDFGLLFGHIESMTSQQKKDVTVEPCLRLTTAVHTRTEHPLARQSRVSLAELAEYQWVISTLTEGQGIADIFTNAGVQCPNIISRANSFDFIVALVEAQDFITILPVQIVDNYHRETLTQLSNADIQFHPSAFIICSNQFAMPEPAKGLKARMQTFMSSLGAPESAMNAYAPAVAP